MNYSERVVTFDCEGDTLVGILAMPTQEVTTSTGIVVIVGGPQYRAGSHRQFVLLSRALAAAGYPVMRFDYRGMGDSTGEKRDFLQVTPDIQAAIEKLQQLVPKVKQLVLWGLCDAAAAALLYCHDTNDARVRGLCLVNPWVRSEATLALTQVKYYYLARLQQKDFWVKLLRGKVAMGALQTLLRNLRLASSASGGKTGASPLNGGDMSSLPFQQRMAKAWHGFPGGILLLLSGDDYTAKEFVEYAQADIAWSRAFHRARLQRHDITDADHTFSSGGTQVLAENATMEWLGKQEGR